MEKGRSEVIDLGERSDWRRTDGDSAERFDIIFDIASTRAKKAKVRIRDSSWYLASDTA